MDGLAKRAALADLDDVTFLDNKGWAAVSWDLSVPLLETLVLRDPVEVIAADDNSAAHLSGDDNTPHETATDRDRASERALAVDVLALDSSGWGSNAKTDIPVITWLSLLTTVLL